MTGGNVMNVYRLLICDVSRPNYNQVVKNEQISNPKKLNFKCIYVFILRNNGRKCSYIM
jgi:hypothetical protein